MGALSRVHVSLPQLEDESNAKVPLDFCDGAGDHGYYFDDSDPDGSNRTAKLPVRLVYA